MAAKERKEHRETNSIFAFFVFFRGHDLVFHPPHASVSRRAIGIGVKFQLARDSYPWVSIGRMTEFFDWERWRPAGVVGDSAPGEGRRDASAPSARRRLYHQIAYTQARYWGAILPNEEFCRAPVSIRGRVYGLFPSGLPVKKGGNIFLWIP